MSGFAHQQEAPSLIIEQRGPFTVKSREIRHDRFGMQLIADKIIKQTDDGNEVEAEQFWLHFTRDAVLIFALCGNLLYLTQEFTYGTGEYALEAPGGSIEEGETPEQAAVRELQEELGLEAKSLIYLGYTRQLTSRVHHCTHLFLACGAQLLHTKHLDPTEVIQAYPVSLAQAYALVEQGEITTAVVEIGIRRIRHYLEHCC